MNKDEIINDIQFYDEALHINFFYPRNKDKIKFFQIGLYDVRAADNIRISYDFERDGYKIEQASIFEWKIDDNIMDHDWKEVAFISAWGREKFKDGNKNT